MIKRPAWAKGAVPTPQGWRNPRTNELLKSMRISQVNIDAFNGVNEPMESKATTLTESPTNEDEFILEHMTKKELEEVAREKGVELDRRLNKITLVEQVKDIFGR